MENKEGIYLIDKEPGWTSFDVVAKIRKQLTENRKQKIKVGHTGTLDPFATGLLIILIGKEFTRCQDEFMKKDKEYEAILKLGEESTTGDPEGVITNVTSAKGQTLGKPSKEEIEETLKGFIGEIEQTPPVHSAIKVSGERAYKKARRGEDFEIPKRNVTIYGLELISYEYPLIKFRVSCSSGTYIRSLATDIAESLGTKGYLTELRRTHIGKYDVRDARNMAALTKS